VAEEIFTTNGSWEAPAGVTEVIVECWGGGGAGGGRTSSNGQGGGGGGGAYSKSTLAVTPSNSYAYVVGATVTGVSTNVTGATGNDTYWVDVSTVLAKGGGGGGTNSSANTATGGAGGLASAGVGTLKYDGGAGVDGISTYGGGGGSGAGSSGAGNPGSTSTGGTAVSDNGGAGGNGSTANSAGLTGELYGGGGGGGRRTNGSRAGGNGRQGLIRITYTAATPGFSSTIAHHMQISGGLL